MGVFDYIFTAGKHHMRHPYSLSSHPVDEYNKEKSSDFNVALDEGNNIKPHGDDLSPNIIIEAEKNDKEHDEPHLNVDKSNPFSALGSLSLISSSSNEEVDCSIVKCVENQKILSSSDKSVFIRTLRSGKIFFSDADKMSRKPKIVSRSFSKQRKVVSRKVIFEKKFKGKGKAPMIESECLEAEKESQHIHVGDGDSDENYIQDMEMDQMMDELPDDMPLCQFLPKKDLKRKANDSPNGNFILKILLQNRRLIN
ncbi:hypothetical protein ZOSMA_319G00070 [Zostera marina]|uniref:Uncharacterized protein n=1 Tax=Zostera marina TaxID=29655 RepID=A0A0K9P913_ZOSMR|nr:hypothetical protein ZOSMA_319G00070 [Zostera marina]